MRSGWAAGFSVLPPAAPTRRSGSATPLPCCFTPAFFTLCPLCKKCWTGFSPAQNPDGQIQDWVDTAGRCDKNTVETDQESSLVLAAYQLALCDPGWLGGEVAGISRLLRLDKSLEWVWNRKRDRACGLIWSGFTADWGDVERSYADSRATKLSDRSRRTFSIYTQAMFIQAAQRMVLLAERLGRRELADKWQQREKAVAADSRRQLYLPEQGYFLVHRVSGRPDFFELEKDILAVGGNAEAMRAGLMNKAEVARFLGVLEAKRRQLGLRSVSFTLLPPYPEGFFPHPLLRSPWSYQNGGEWDWIGGRLVSALYQYGFRKEADKYLEEIVGKKFVGHEHLRMVRQKRQRPGGPVLCRCRRRPGRGDPVAAILGLAGGFRPLYPAGRSADRFKVTVAKAGDRFTVDNADRLVIDIAALSKKEVCVLTGSGGEKICTRYSKTIVKSKK